MNGSRIADLLCDWANRKGLHSDDFNDLFVHELLEMLDADEEDEEDF